MNPVEVFGFITGVLNVWLLARQNIWNWPIAILNNLVYFVVFLHSGLYADSGLQVVFFLLGVYGWWTWSRRRAAVPELAITRTPRELWAWLVPAMVGSALLLRYVLARYTDSTVPGWDGTTAAISLAAIYGQGRKFLESWWLWIAADIICIPLYVYKQLYLTSALYAVFLALCIIGLIDWRKALAKATDGPDCANPQQAS